MRLKIADILKFGALYSQNGEWNSKQLSLQIGLKHQRITILLQNRSMDIIGGCWITRSKTVTRIRLIMPWEWEAREDNIYLLTGTNY